jgi:hypothetical protein
MEAWVKMNWPLFLLCSAGACFLSAFLVLALRCGPPAEQSAQGADKCPLCQQQRQELKEEIKKNILEELKPK